MTEYVTHPLILPETIRRQDQQLHIAMSSMKDSSLVVAPTGTGKTVIALLSMLPVLEQGGTVLFMAPTRPLVAQHVAFLQKVLDSNVRAMSIDGTDDPKTRADVFDIALCRNKACVSHTAAVLVATPQTIDNDLQAGRYTLQDIAMIVYDEAHHAAGEYAYCHVAEAYEVQGPRDRRALGITASPGHQEEDIEAVCEALHLSQVLTAEAELNISEDVLELDMPPEMARSAAVIRQMISQHERNLRHVLPFGVRYSGRRDDLVVLMNRASQEVRRGLSYEEKGPWFAVMSWAGGLLKLHHAAVLAESQGLGILQKYLEGLSSDTSKAGKRIASDPHIRAIIRDERMTMDPKGATVEKLLEDLPRGSKTLVFCTYRDTVDAITRTINTDCLGIRAAPFIGQSSGNGKTGRGMSQKDQAATIQDFRDGALDVLVCTCIGEEGIDIPAVDLVIFYEPTPSAIRDIQRRGRTGRFGASGRVVILMYRGGVDEGYFYSSRRKKEEMQTTLEARCST